MRKIVIVIGLMFCSGCTTVPTWLKDDVKEYVEDKLEQGKKEIISQAEEKVTEFVEEKLEEFEGEMDKRETEANRVIAKDLGIKESDFDIDGDGKLNETEKIPYAMEIVKKGREKGLPLTTILVVIALALFSGDVRKMVGSIGKRILGKVNGNGD
jgi:hypothetical protein